MGGLCSGGANAQRTKKISSEFSGHLNSFNGSRKHEANVTTGNLKTEDVGYENQRERFDSGPLPASFSSELRPSGSTASRGSRKGSVRRASIAGIEMAVEVLDTLGSSMTNLNARGGFVSGMASRGNKISILAFEVANTIAKGSNLLQSLSGENIKLFKKETFPSEAVQKLVSGDTKELLSIAAADKRYELDAFSKEVIRFGDLCRDLQWHSLGRYFSKLESDHSIHISLRNEAEAAMQELTTMAQYTSELYHEMNALDRFEQDYAHRIEEADSLKLPRKGESLTILQSEIKQQRKLVRSLQKKSIWSKTLEEVVEKLVDIVAYMHQAIAEVFEETRSTRKQPSESPQTLGSIGLALHYANIVHQIDSMASHPASVPTTVRDTLYNALPDTVKKSLRSQLHSIDKGKLSISYVKDQMDKTLCWLIPVAANTIKAHQGFGWVGEWANNGNEFCKTTARNDKPTRLQTFYHADKQKTEVYILELVAWLHHLIILIRQRDLGTKPLAFHTKMHRMPSLDHVPNKIRRVELSQQERSLLENVTERTGAVRGRSKSEDFEQGNKKEKRNRWVSRSAGNSPARGFGARLFRRRSLVNLLDVMDGLGSSFSEPKS